MKITDRYDQSDQRLVVISDFTPPRGGDPSAVDRVKGLNADFICVAYNPGKLVRADPVAAAVLEEVLQDSPPDVILNATGFAVSVPGVDRTPGPFDAAQGKGRAGPVVIALPEDMLAESAEVADVASFQTAEAAPAPEAMGRLEHMLRDSACPLMIVGGRGWTPPTRDAVQTFAAAWDLRVAAAFRYQDRFDNELDHYVVSGPG